MSNFKIRDAIFRATIVTTISLGIGSYFLYRSHQNYWNKTIYRVQTVDFNILSHTLPTTISHLLIEGKTEELQAVLESNYGLFGLIVTDKDASKVLYHSSFRANPQWEEELKNLENIPLDNYQFSFLRDPLPTAAEFSYPQSYSLDTEVSIDRQKNTGQTIGRLYYVRGIPPNFQKDLSGFLRKPWKSSSRYVTYRLVSVASLLFGIIIWAAIEFRLYKLRERDQLQKNLEQQLKRQQENYHKREKSNQAEINQKNEALQDLEADLSKKLEEKEQQNNELKQIAQENQQERNRVQVLLTKQEQDIDDLLHEQEILLQEKEDLVNLQAENKKNYELTVENIKQTAENKAQKVYQDNEELYLSEIVELETQLEERQREFENQQEIISRLSREIHFWENYSSQFLQDQKNSSEITPESFIDGIADLSFALVAGTSQDRRKMMQWLCGVHGVEDDNISQVPASKQKHINTQKIKSSIQGKDYILFFYTYAGHDTSNILKNLRETRYFTTEQLIYVSRSNKQSKEVIRERIQKYGKQN